MGPTRKGGPKSRSSRRKSKRTSRRVEAEALPLPPSPAAPSVEGAAADHPPPMDGVVCPPVEEAAPALRPLCEEVAPVHAPEAEDLQNLLMEFGWQGHPVSWWRALRVLGWLLPSHSEQERIACLLNLYRCPMGFSCAWESSQLALSQLPLSLFCW